MAEVETPRSASDWSEDDRLSFTERWNGANAFNLLRHGAGAKEYQTIRERAYFYDWFDQIREVQGHDVLWPAAAWLVAMQMGNVENPIRNFFIPAGMKPMAMEGNKAIFDDVFPRLAALFEDGLKGKKLTGKEARKWDWETLRREQFVVMPPIYEKYVGQTPSLSGDLADLASGRGIYAAGGLAIGNALDFKGDILDPRDRFYHGAMVVKDCYNKFKQSIDSSRKRRQRAQADPTVGGRIAVRR